MPFRKSDFVDADILDAPELMSDGTSVYLTGILISVSGGVGTVTLDNTELTSADNPVQGGDRVHITGTTVDGWYTVGVVLSETTFTVNEAIGSYFGSGSVSFIYQSGASKIGFNISEMVVATNNTVQGAIEQVDALLVGGSSGEVLASTGGGVPGWINHDTLRKLVHMQNGPFEGFSGAYKEVLPVGVFPTSVIWYTDSSKAHKVISKDIAYNANRTVSSLIWKVYDSSGVVVETLTETMTYTGIFETSRTRTIS